MVKFIKSVFIIIGCMFAGALVGFFGPFILAQFGPEGAGTALSMMTMITVPIGIVLGLIVGLFIVFGISFPMVLIPIGVTVGFAAVSYFLFFAE
ncbi:hypothetical protein P3G55_01495 [Leptospira sp. 96542]|nr:hypothetical protein [Leptospira sp. 96542]